MPIIVENLSLLSGREWKFRDLFFEIDDGSVFGILAEAGVGTRSILSVLAGDQKPTSGSVAAKTDARALEYFEFEPHTSPFSRIFGSRHGGSDLAARSADTMRAIEGSRGPLALFEPFLGLSEAGKAPLIDAITRLAKEKRFIVVLASSDFESLAAVCDRMIAIDEGGRPAQTGSPQDLYETPASSGVAKLTGRVNLIEARRITSSRSEHPEFHTIDGGHRFFAQRTDLKRLGAINANVKLSIRPEQLSIAFGASFPEDNLLKGTVTRTTFLGNTSLVEVDCGGLHLQAQVFKLVGLSVGDDCMVSLPPDRIRVLAT